MRRDKRLILSTNGHTGVQLSFPPLALLEDGWSGRLPRHHARDEAEPVEPPRKRGPHWPSTRRSYGPVNNPSLLRHRPFTVIMEFFYIDADKKDTPRYQITPDKNSRDVRSAKSAIKVYLEEEIEEKKKYRYA